MEAHARPPFADAACDEVGVVLDAVGVGERGDFFRIGKCAEVVRLAADDVREQLDCLLPFPRAERAEPREHEGHRGDERAVTLVRGLDVALDVADELLRRAGVEHLPEFL